MGVDLDSAKLRHSAVGQSSTIVCYWKLNQLAQLNPATSTAPQELREQLNPAIHGTHPANAKQTNVGIEFRPPAHAVRSTVTLSVDSQLSKKSLWSNSCLDSGIGSARGALRLGQLVSQDSPRMWRYRVQVIKDTEQDLIDIHLYVAAHNSAINANYVLGQLETLCLGLAELPLRGQCRPSSIGSA